MRREVCMEVSDRCKRDSFEIPEILLPCRRSQNLNFNRKVNFLCLFLGDLDESGRLAVSDRACVRSFGRCCASKFGIPRFLVFLQSLHRSLPEMKLKPKAMPEKCNTVEKLLFNAVLPRNLLCMVDLPVVVEGHPLV